VTPASHPHEYAINALRRQAEGALEEERGPLTGRVELADPFPATIDLGALRWTGRWA
jgi:hypothetical protein